MAKGLKTPNGFRTYSSWSLRINHLGSRGLRRFRGFFRKIVANLRGTEISGATFQKSLLPEYLKTDDFLAHFKAQRSRSFFVETRRKEETLASLRKLCPSAWEYIIKAANTICEHRFDLLGSGLVNLGWPIDWHSDFKSGYRWNPRQYYAEIRPAPYPGGYDLKVPWELSRCQHFVWLGQAYWLTGDEKYSNEFRAEVEDWIEQNTPEFGVNWACSMDIAIRAVNWLWGYGFFQTSPVLDDDFRIVLCKSLLCHGRHIMANLERTATFAGNHYLSDIVGLVYLGILLPEFKEAQVWREFGLKELEREMFKQVYPDGGNFEASTNYHRLVTELFLSSTLLARLNGHNFSQRFMEQLEKMLELIHQITKPDGTTPVIGDQDNGRLHRLKVWEDPGLEWKDFRALLAIGAVLFERSDWGKMCDDQWEEAIWFYGGKTLTAYQKSIADSQIHVQSTEFKDTGLYLMRAEDIYVAVDLGTIGQNGYGGHAHNDTLSFEVFSSGQTWIQDPGTYVYTSDYKARNFFRSTAFHNTLIFPNYEQNRFDALNLFRLKNESISRLLSWHVEPGLDTYMAGKLRRNKYPEITHCRSFFLDRSERALVITDWVSSMSPTCQSVLHFSPGLNIELIEQPILGARLTNSNGEDAWIFSVLPVATKMQLSAGWISESYGVRKPSDIVTFEWPVDKNHKVVILLAGNRDSIQKRVKEAIQNETVFQVRHQLIAPEKISDESDNC
jgi:heparinase II/III-like protein